jgi:hypothetical protein
VTTLKLLSKQAELAGTRKSLVIMRVNRGHLSALSFRYP